MTTITYPTSNVGSVLIGAIGGALAMLVLVAAMALAALNAAAPITEPAPAPAPVTDQSTWEDPTPLGGVMEHAD